MCVCVLHCFEVFLFLFLERFVNEFLQHKTLTTAFFTCTHVKYFCIVGETTSQSLLEIVSESQKAHTYCIQCLLSR